MTATLTSLSRDASEIAVRASGARLALTQPIGTGIVPRVAIQDLPAPTDVGWTTPESGAMLAVVQRNADVRRRTMYLVIDRSTAPLTGNYVVEITRGATTESVTYNATSSAPADVDALLAGIAAALVADSAFAAEVEADTYATVPGGDLDAIRLRGTVTDASAFAGFILTSNTAFPAGASMVAHVELAADPTAIVLYGKPQPVIASAAASGQPWSDMTSQWTPAGTLAAGAQRIDVSGLSAVMAVPAWTAPSDTYSTITVVLAIYFCPATL